MRFGEEWWLLAGLSLSEPEAPTTELLLHDEPISAGLLSGRTSTGPLITGRVLPLAATGLCFNLSTSRCCVLLATLP